MSTETLTPEKVAAVCDGCKAKRDVKVLKDSTEPCIPKNWHRSPKGELFCQKCWGKRYKIRPIFLPVQGFEGITHKDFYAILRPAWMEATLLANWAWQQLMKADGVLKSDGKVPPLPEVYIYGIAVREYPRWAQWAGMTSSAQSIFQDVLKDYKANRLDLLRYRRSGHTFKFPFPIPVHNQAWQAEIDESGNPSITLPLCGRRYKIRLRGGAPMFRQIQRLKMIVSGEAPQCELKIGSEPATKGDHRSSAKKFNSGKPATLFRAKLVPTAWFPRYVNERELKGEIKFLSQPDAFCRQADAEFVINADHAKRWSDNYGRFRHRLAQDTKYEKRVLKHQRKAMGGHGDARSQKYNQRIDTFMKQTAASLAKYAQRQGKAVLIFDSCERGYFEGEFNWSGFELRLKNACDGLNIELKFINPATPPEEEAPPEE